MLYKMRSDFFSKFYDKDGVSGILGSVLICPGNFCFLARKIPRPKFHFIDTNSYKYLLNIIHGGGKEQVHKNRYIDKTEVQRNYLKILKSRSTPPALRLVTLLFSQYRHFDPNRRSGQMKNGKTTPMRNF